MKRAVIPLIVAVLTLAGCGREIEKQRIKTKGGSEEVVTSEETTAAEDSAVTTAAEKPAVTTVKEESSVAETEKKKADPDEIDVACMDIVEVYQRVRLDEFMFDSNAKLLNGDELLDTEELGEHEVTLKLELEGGEAEKTLRYTVADITPPVLLLGDNVLVGVGTWFDLGEHISYADNYDRSPDLSWEGDVDTSEEGIYPITLYITDSSGNQLVREIKVAVSDSGSDYYYEDAPIYFSDFAVTYDEPGREFGIDVSRWQGEIDFDAVAAEGCSFAIIRMGYGQAGGADLDEYYYDNIEGAANAGLDVGVYFYSTDTSREGARATAQRIVEVLDGRELDFPVVFDWEEFGCFQNYGMSLHDLGEVYEAFAEELEKNGYEAMLYGSKNFLETAWENRENRPVWVAHYVEETTYSGRWFMWQRCGTGRISGINGAVDLDVLEAR